MREWNQVFWGAKKTNGSSVTRSWRPPLAAFRTVSTRNTKPDISSYKTQPSPQVCAGYGRGYGCFVGTELSLFSLKSFPAGLYSWEQQHKSPPG